MQSSIDMGSYESLATAKGEVTVAEVEILVHPENIRTLTDELTLNYEALVANRGGNFDVTNEEMFKFFITAIKARVDYVSGSSRDYKSFVQYTEHPHILGVVVANIGNAFDEQTLIDLRPIINNDIKKWLLSEDEYLALSRKIRALRANFGISVGQEMPNDKKGDFLTMSFAFVEGAVKREDTRAHPTQALLALISGVNLATSIITPRVTYITPDRVRTLIQATAGFELPKGRAS